MFERKKVKESLLLTEEGGGRVQGGMVGMLGGARPEVELRSRLSG